MKREEREIPESPEVDLALLSVARVLLERAGFSVAEGNLPGIQIPWLLAENGLIALGLAAGRRLRDLVTMEAHGAAALAERMHVAGPKRWDVYLVLLAREDLESRGSREVRRIQYDTSQLRRVVSLGVQADEESVRRALRPFLPLPAPSEQYLGSVWGDLEAELVLQGIDPAQVRAIIDRQQESEAAWLG